MKRLVVLGSTGSVGEQTLAVAESNPSRFRVVALAARRSAAKLADQVRRFRPQVVARGMKIHNGGMPMVAAPMRMDGERAVSRLPAPRLDEHGSAIRDALARSDGWPAAD